MAQSESTRAAEALDLATTGGRILTCSCGDMPVYHQSEVHADRWLLYCELCRFSGCEQDADGSVTGHGPAGEGATQEAARDDWNAQTWERIPNVVPTGGTLAMLFPKCTTCGSEMETESDSDTIDGRPYEIHYTKCDCSWGEGDTEEEAEENREHAAQKRSDSAEDWRRPDMVDMPRKDCGWMFDGERA